jgi:putative NIF3 family GTP cyclohydrolase 1 type 2
MGRAWTLQEIREHVFGVASWVDPERTCDVVFRGAPGTRVRRVGVGWSCCAPNLEAAAAAGCDLYIGHEALLHGPEWAPGLDSADTPWGRHRLAVLEDAGMACMRLHDTWDNFPEHGIRDAWRRFLGLGEPVAECAYHYPGRDRFAPRNSLVLSPLAQPCSLRAFAADLARRCRVFPCFQGATLHGDPEAVVRLAATGVGCHVPGLEMLERGADVLVVTLDRAKQESFRIPLAEVGANLVAVEHGVSEMPGMARLAAYLERTFPGLRATFHCEEPRAETVTGEP